jgi:hypothetical protein
LSWRRNRFPKRDHSIRAAKGVARHEIGPIVGRAAPLAAR